MITIHNENVTLDQLHDVKVKRPKKAGRFWEGIPHGDLVDSILDELHLRDYKVQGMNFALSVDHADLAGTFELEIPKMKAPNGMAFNLGFLTSNAMKRALKIVVGTRVFVCNNGMATGQIILKHKHTKNFDLGEELSFAIDDYTLQAQKIENMVESFRERTLKEAEVEHLLINAGREGMMPWSRLGCVDKEYHRPSYQDHDERTSFGLLQAFTHVAKRNPVFQQMQQMDAFRQSLPRS